MQKIKQFWFLLGLVLVFMAVIIDRTDTLAGIGIFFKDNYASEIIIFLIFTVSVSLLANLKQ
jgi:hypothetical protein